MDVPIHLWQGVALGVLDVRQVEALESSIPPSHLFTTEIKVEEHTPVRDVVRSICRTALIKGVKILVLTLPPAAAPGTELCDELLLSLTVFLPPSRVERMCIARSSVLGALSSRPAVRQSDLAERESIRRVFITASSAEEMRIIDLKLEELSREPGILAPPVWNTQYKRCPSVFKTLVDFDDVKEIK